MERRDLIQWIPRWILTLGASSAAVGQTARTFLGTATKQLPQSSTFMASGAVADPASAAGSAASLGRPPILYIQTVRYKPGVSAETINQLLTSLQETLSAIPQIRSIRIARVIDKDPEYDYAVVMEFDNVNDMKTYGNSAIHRHWVEEHNPQVLAASHATLTLQMNGDH